MKVEEDALYSMMAGEANSRRRLEPGRQQQQYGGGRSNPRERRVPRRRVSRRADREHALFGVRRRDGGGRGAERAREAGWCALAAAAARCQRLEHVFVVRQRPAVRRRLVVGDRPRRRGCGGERPSRREAARHGWGWQPEQRAAKEGEARRAGKVEGGSYPAQEGAEDDDGLLREAEMSEARGISLALESYYFVCGGESFGPLLFGCC